MNGTTQILQIRAPILAEKSRDCSSEVRQKVMVTSTSDSILSCAWGASTVGRPLSYQQRTLNRILFGPSDRKFVLVSCHAVNRCHFWSRRPRIHDTNHDEHWSPQVSRGRERVNLGCLQQQASNDQRSTHNKRQAKVSVLAAPSDDPRRSITQKEQFDRGSSCSGIPYEQSLVFCLAGGAGVLHHSSRLLHRPFFHSSLEFHNLLPNVKKTNAEDSDVDM